MIFVSQIELSGRAEPLGGALEMQAGDFGKVEYVGVTRFDFSVWN